MQWPRAGVTSRRRTPHCRHSRARRLRFCHSCARCSFLSPSPLGGRGEGEGGRWRHLVPLGASPLFLRLRLRGASPPLLDPLPRWGRGIRKRGCATRVPAAMQWPRAGVTAGAGRPTVVIPPRGARSCFPLPLGGEGRVRGAAGATSSLWVRPPLPSTPLALRSGRRLDPLPRRGRGIRKRGMRDARPCRYATAARGGDKQEADAPLPSFARAASAEPGIPLGRARGRPRAAAAVLGVPSASLRAGSEDRRRTLCARE